MPSPPSSAAGAAAAPEADYGIPALQTARELVERLAWIGRLRWLATAGVAAAITVARFGFEVALPTRPLYGLVIGLGAYNGLLHLLRWRLAQSSLRAVSALANGQLAVDLLFLAGLIYFAGGIENPFTTYFVFHVVIAAILLSRRATYGQTALACGLVLLMAALQATQAAPHYHLHPMVPREVHLSPEFAYGTAFAVITTLLLTAYFATSITARLRQREAEVLALTRSLEQKAQDLARSNEGLRAAERARSEYMRRVAHELRSPLSTLDQMAHVMIERRLGDIPPQVEQTLQRMQVRLHMLMEVARDLLALSRARESDLTRAMRQVRLAEVAEALAPDLAQRAEKGGVALRIDLPPDLPPIMGDPEGLAQLVMNLGTNAIKYTRPGGRVEIVARPHDGGVQLTVADTGIGIPADDLPNIFNEFYRASNARHLTEEGTGLGLSIVNTICYSHRAEITVESEPGQGTTFSVRFPALDRFEASDRAAA